MVHLLHVHSSSTGTAKKNGAAPGGLKKHHSFATPFWGRPCPSTLCCGGCPGGGALFDRDGPLSPLRVDSGAGFQIDYLIISGSETPGSGKTGSPGSTIFLAVSAAATPWQFFGAPLLLAGAVL